MKKETFNQIFIGTSTAVLIGLGGYLFTSFKTDIVREQKQNTDIKEINRKCVIIDSLQQVKNGNLNYRFDQLKDKNAISHKEIRNELKELKEIVIRIDTRLKIWEQQNNLVNK